MSTNMNAAKNGAASPSDLHESASSKQSSNVEYRRLPSVELLLRQPEISYLSAQYGDTAVTNSIRAIMAASRSSIAQGEKAPDEGAWVQLIDDYLSEQMQPSLRSVINATGVIIHTNLGRAPLSDAARTAVESVSAGFNNLEYDLAQGKRGSRYSHSRELLTQLTGAEDALVVNNCASAVFLALTALCQEREVVVSRGQLVEIGGGFRIPDVLRQSGATLVEVGTTNRTHPADFENAITPHTAALMRIHSSNFRLMGFVTMPKLEELVAIAHRVGEPQNHTSLVDNRVAADLSHQRPIVIDDLGSGTLLPTEAYGLEREPTVRESIEAGADVVAFSGDKLLGGPQAGILVGGAAYIEQLRKHPLARALRVDKMTLAALEATLRAYASDRALDEIPVWRMISATKDEMRVRAEAWQQMLSEQGLTASVWDGESAVGGGSLPGETLPTALLAVDVAAQGYQPDDCAARLREGALPIVSRIQNDHLVFDPRTVLAGQEKALLQGIRELF